jgi:hypothetical protein
VAISGTTAVVGAPGHANFGGDAYVFTKTAAGWEQVTELKASDTEGSSSANIAGDGFGLSVAISGRIAVVGAYGHANGAGRVYVFTKTAGGWKQTAELKGTDTVAGNNFGHLGCRVGHDCDRGCAQRCQNGAGRAYVFTETSAGWTQVAELKGSDTIHNDDFGISVAISGTTAIVGANDRANHAGAAYVFTKTAAGWKQVAELKGSDTTAGDFFGTSVAISGTTAFIGSSGNAKKLGRAYVFTKTAADWEQVAELKGSDTTAHDDFGISVAGLGTTAIVGAPYIANKAGAAYLFTKTAGSWKQAAELEGSDTVDGDDFGLSVAMSGTTAVVGAQGHAKDAGEVYVFEV